MKKVLVNILKAVVCGAVFFAGNMLASIIAAMIGIPAPAAPDGTDPARLVLGLLAASMGIGVLLAYLSGRIAASWPLRWAVLASFGWIIYSFTNNLEASIYTTYASASTYKLVTDLAAFLLCGLAAARLFAPTLPARQQAAGRSAGSWIWRLVVLEIAFPVIYLSFGKLVEPFVIDFYLQGLMGLAAPGWDQIIPMQLLRSLLFLAVSLPVVFLWTGPRRSLWASLAAALFLLTGGFYMIQAYWYPAGFRLLHSLEILCDSAIYGGALALLLFNPAEKAAGESAAQVQPSLEGAPK